MIQRKLGGEKADMVLRAFAANQQHFGFIKIKKEELAELTTPFSPGRMPLHLDVYTFRAGIWLVVIVSHTDYIEVTSMNPYDANEHFTVIAE